MKMRDARVWVAAWLLYACGGGLRSDPARPAPTTPPPPAPISAMEAVAAAEAFVVVNGYTDLPGATEISELTTEPIEWFAPEEWLLHRHNTVEHCAYGYSRGRRRDSMGWTVVFRHAGDGPSDTGRAVTMDE